MFDFLTAINKQLFVLMLKNKIIGITNIPLDSQFVLNELIQFVQVYIREQSSTHFLDTLSLRDFPN